MRTISVLVLYLLLTQTAVLAQSTSEELRKIARNPFAGVVKLPFEEDVTFQEGPSDRTASILQIQPVIPFQITDNCLLVTRIVTAAFVYQPALDQGSGGTTGLGDTTISFFFTPSRARSLIWGLGPALLAPTATDNALGSGKWGLGPSFAVLTQPEWRSVGVLVQNIWSIAGASKRTPVNQLQLQPSFSYNLPHGWYAIISPTIAADWTQPTEQRWLVPVGGGAGRSLHIGKRAADANLTVYWNSRRPAGFPEWQISLQFTLLFPEGRTR